MLVFVQVHHDPKPKDSDSEDDGSVERRKPEGARLPPQREKGPSNTSDVSCERNANTCDIDLPAFDGMVL